jgi:2-amino-4-hydroxy-6-hydroxymethyldihydropteridine diphosphokinase
MIPVFITLGSNIEPERNLPAAVRLLADHEGITVLRVSRVYRSPAIGADGKVNPDQQDFLNAAVLIETNLPILKLKKNILRQIEAQLERVRTKDKYAARTIDLDIALFGNDTLGLIIEEPDGSGETVFPDPDITRFAHVALPLADLDPDFVHPLTGETLGEIGARFGDAEGIEVYDLRLSSS